MKGGSGSDCGASSKLDTNNWKPLLAFRKRLIAGEVALESSTASVAPTGQVGETTTVRGVRAYSVRSARRRSSRFDLVRTDMAVSQIAAKVGVAENTVPALPPGLSQPPCRRRRFTSDDLRRAQQLHAQGRTHIEIGLELAGRDTVKKHLATAQGDW